MDSTSFDLSDLDAIDEAEMVVTVGGKPTDWTWFFSGPGHPQTVAQSNRVAREELNKQRSIEQARANGRKYKSEQQTPDGLLADNVAYVMERLLRWSPVKMDGQDFPYSQENARTLLMDRKKGSLLQQAVDFLLDDQSFTKRSPKT
jgi:hypothetical protein